MNVAVDYDETSGNVFDDLDLPDPEIRLAKAKLARQITKIVDKCGWNQAEAATALGIHQVEISQIARDRLHDFSLDRLTGVLTRARATRTRQ